MCESKMEDMPLPALFEQGRKIHLQATESGADQDLVKKGCETLEKCEDMISKLGLFSSNETKDDISTKNLKYILEIIQIFIFYFILFSIIVVPFYLGELTERIVQNDKIQILETSQAKLREFISFCEAMDLVPKEEMEVAVLGASNSLADRRALQIARFSRLRAAAAKLTEIKERKEQRERSTKAAALSTPVEHGEEDVQDDDGEEEREASLTTISFAICKAFDLLEMLKKEEDMLSAIREKQLKGKWSFLRAVLYDCTKNAEAWHRDAASRAGYTKPALPISCATFAQDVIDGRAKVSEAHYHKHQPMDANDEHRGSWSEGGEMEMMSKWQERNAKMFEEANSAWYKDRPKFGPSEDDEDDDDAAQEKARAWDDWKDDNPRGAGNKKLTPCG
ncbi:PP2A regulatory subunit TAP46 [Hibiscus syriacus]|uniref:PP2A regulatory subunit TAP46 n=1 Tax=Hibiscus syriacus TaxID=106335 RepID=A0A6A3C7R4_HIBSY|nr:PP2A regulatory subunit TAP46 [Hibiscus syriacus]